MMIPTEYQDRPVLGREIPWDNMGESAFKISHFIPFARMKDDKIDAPRPPQPYALLAAENPEFERAVLIPVVHRLDFGVAWEIFEDKGVPPEQEILVLRDRSVDSPVPRFQFAVTLKGALDKLYATGEMDENSLIGRYDPLEYDSEVTRTALGLGLLVSDARAAERPGLIPVDTFISVRMLRQLQWGGKFLGLFGEEKCRVSSIYAMAQQISLLALAMTQRKGKRIPSVEEAPTSYSAPGVTMQASPDALWEVEDRIRASGRSSPQWEDLCPGGVDALRRPGAHRDMWRITGAVIVCNMEFNRALLLGQEHRELARHVLKNGCEEATKLWPDLRAEDPGLPLNPPCPTVETAEKLAQRLMREWEESSSGA